MKICFLILHFNTPEQTLNCVDSILTHTEEIQDKCIAILDNGSSEDEISKTVKQRYSENIVLLFKSEKNLGFANGNNYLLEQVKQIDDFDFYVFLNNDVYIVSNDFCTLIEKEYKKSQFAILGPRIILGNNTIDSCPFEIAGKDEIKHEICFWKRAYFFANLHCAKIYLKFISIKNFCAKKLFLKKKVFIDKAHRKENVLLHGACLIFSKRYFEFYREAFDPRTFLYKEEELLYLRCKRKNLLTIFAPDLIVYHEGGVSTTRKKNLNQIYIFRAQHYLNSLNILFQELYGDSQS